MDYTLIPHAMKRVAQRGVTLDMVDNVLQNPGQVVDEKFGRKAYQSKVIVRKKDFLLRVIVDDSVDPSVIYTVILTNQIDRYWK